MDRNSQSNETRRPKQIAVLGGLGFMGSHVCRALIQNRHRTIVFDRPGTSREAVSDIEAKLEIISGDISRPDEVLQAIAGVDAVINLVHTTVPGSSMVDPVHDVTSNVAASVGWLSRLRETNVQQLIYFSSGGTVYGRPLTNPIDEDHPTDPISSYGISKLAIEKYVALYSGLSGIEYRILRPSNVYGVGQQLHHGQGVIGVMAQRALLGEPLEIWGTGEYQRDYLYVDDLVTALMGVLDYAGPTRIFNVSSGEGHSILDIVEVLRRQLGELPEIQFSAERKFDVPHNVLNSNRLRTELGWKPAVSLEQGIARTLEWLKTTPKSQDSRLLKV